MQRDMNRNTPPPNLAHTSPAEFSITNVSAPLKSGLHHTVNSCCSLLLGWCLRTMRGVLHTHTHRLTHNLHEFIVYKWTSCPLSLLCHQAGCVPPLVSVSYPPSHRSAVCHFTNDPLLLLSPQTSRCCHCRYPSAPLASGHRYSTMGIVLKEMRVKRRNKSPVIYLSRQKKKKMPRQTTSITSCTRDLVD